MTIEVQVHGDAEGGWIVECRDESHYGTYQPEAATAEDAAAAAKAEFTKAFAPKADPKDALLEDMNATIARQTDALGKYEEQVASQAAMIDKLHADITEATKQAAERAQTITELEGQLAVARAPKPAPEPTAAAEQPAPQPSPAQGETPPATA
jgi:septal ring factor EnvC (AmiA/AmiB activator)